jgi:hypothetical protein
MSRIAQVLSSERVQDDGGHGVDVKADPGGGDAVLAPLFVDPGTDALPLPGDFVALDDSSGTGGEQATGFADVRNAGKAKPGETRLYSRASDGAVKVEIYLQGDGALTIGNGAGAIVLEKNGDVTINGLRIAKDGKVTGTKDIVTSGNVTADGEVTAMAKTPKAIPLSKHAHLTAGVGPPSPPLPGPPPPPAP